MQGPRPEPQAVSCRHSQPPLEGTADFVNNFLTDAGIDFTRHILSTATSLPGGKACPRVVFKTVTLFIVWNGCMQCTNG